MVGERIRGNPRKPLAPALRMRPLSDHALARELELLVRELAVVEAEIRRRRALEQHGYPTHPPEDALR